jgi:hypothetical protein
MARTMTRAGVRVTMRITVVSWMRGRTRTAGDGAGTGRTRGVRARARTPDVTLRPSAVIMSR